jgi:hypothetical protein
MTDIVERLRKRAATWVSVGWGNNDIFDEAANEIELLRKQLAHSVNLGNSWMDELDRMRKTLRMWVKFWEADNIFNDEALLAEEAMEATRGLLRDDNV